eukprot:TRINITY_DN95153_c0_g1_i1.p1 TRINITY_DN95153_c0_g1~~TRINITY_DN95153_c0_g1_i1.p1  ORF type:complete len:353 (+),score=67.91 TRINITY_DN95153_c0_g1_i1:33-1091(+)
MQKVAATEELLQSLHEGGETSSQALQKLVDELTCGHLPAQDHTLWILRQASKTLAALPTLVEVTVPETATLHVVGDLHGQYCELMTVISLCGMPCPRSNMYLFNGDFVDRGPRSVEVMLVLLLAMLAYPGCVYLNRGNHEFASMGRHYGFEEEVLRKYSQKVFDAFQETFRSLPLATLVNGSVFITHGGLFRSEGVSLRDIAAIDRFRFTEAQSDLAQDLLWSDPINEDGRYTSHRGAGVRFGPDVSERFCKDNGLLCCIRSHEAKQRGFEWQKGGRCLTIFSAANYVGRMGNLGAVCHIKPRGARVQAGDLSISTFEGAADEQAVSDRSGRVQVTFPSSPLRQKTSVRSRL